MAHCYNENSDISQKYLLKVTPPDLSIYNGQFYASQNSREDTFFLKKKGAGVLTDHLQIPFTLLVGLASKI